MFYQVENEKLVLKIFTAKLWDIYCREWFAGLQNNSPSEMYSSFKSCTEGGKYIDIINDIRKACACFGVGVSEINSLHYLPLSIMPRCDRG